MILKTEALVCSYRRCCVLRPLVYSDDSTRIQWPHFSHADVPKHYLCDDIFPCLFSRCSTHAPYQNQVSVRMADLRKYFETQFRENLKRDSYMNYFIYPEDKPFICLFFVLKFLQRIRFEKGRSRRSLGPEPRHFLLPQLYFFFFF